MGIGASGAVLARRGVIACAGAAFVVLAASLAGQLGSADDYQSPAPAPVTSATALLAPTPPLTERPDPTPPIDRPDPTYKWSDTPPRVVLRAPDRDVRLKTWLGCWYGPTGGRCVEEEPEPLAELPDIGGPRAVEFWFGGKGWTFDATFTQLGSGCPRSEARYAQSIGARWFRLKPAGFAGDYRVDLSGHGPHSGIKGVPTMMSFVWHTPVDGPADQPKARVSVGELEVSDLGFDPTSASAQVTITDDNGEETTRRLPAFPDGRCPLTVLGYLLFQGDFIDPAIPELGPAPYRYEVRLVLDGETYLGTAISDEGAYVDPRGAGPGTSADVVWSPPLPAYQGETTSQ
jgi:hypothetical protein